METESRVLAARAVGYSFGPFWLDTANQCVWHDDRAIQLAPKDYAVLQYLVSNPQRLVTKDELLAAVWPDAVVADGILKVSIRKIRRALHERPESPRFIATAHRRGYRFIAPVTTHGVTGSRTDSAAQENSQMVGREAAVSRLLVSGRRAAAGRRQIVFVTGEAGIGKTTLVDAVLDACASHGMCVGRGQSVQYGGAAEPFLPVLEALDRAGRSASGARLRGVLTRRAPAWLLSAGRAGLGRRSSAADEGTSPERHLRDLAEALETFSAATPLVLSLEDLHWSDESTIALLAHLARRTEPARLLILATFRPAEVALADHPVRGVIRELLSQRLCEDIALEGLSLEAVQAYVALRCPEHRFPPALTRVIHERTAGNPLFLTTLVDSLADDGVIARGPDQTWQLLASPDTVARAIPAGLRPAIERQLDQLSAREQGLLEASSVAGVRFFAAAIAAVLGEPALAVESDCEQLSRRSHVIRPIESRELPDGSISAQYAFRHALHRDVLYERIPAGRRAFLHLRMGEQLEALHGGGTDVLAGELAVHFEEGRDYRRAAEYFHLVSEQAIGRCAFPEALNLARRGLACVGRIPSSPEPDAVEIGLLGIIGALQVYHGPAFVDQDPIHERVQALLPLAGRRASLLRPLFRIWSYYLLRSPRHAIGIAERLLEMASPEHGRSVSVAHYALGTAQYYAGRFAVAHAHLEQSLALYEDRPTGRRSLEGGYSLQLRDVRVGLHAYLSLTLWALGRWHESLTHSRRAILLGRASTSVFDAAFALMMGGALHHLRREHRRAGELAEAAIGLIAREGPSMCLTAAVVQRCWATVQEGVETGDTALLARGLAGLQDAGANSMGTRGLAFQAEALAHLGRADEGLALLDRAVAMGETKGCYYYEADLHRLRGALLWPTDEAAAEASYRQSLATARAQGAPALELRAAVVLARLLANTDRLLEADSIVRDVLPSFAAEDDQSMDLIDARAFLRGGDGEAS